MKCIVQQKLCVCSPRLGRSRRHDKRCGCLHVRPPRCAARSPRTHGRLACKSRRISSPDAAFISVYTTRHTRNWDKSSSTGHYTCHTGDAGGAGVLNTRSTRSHAHPQRKYKSRHHATSLDGETGLSPRASQSRPYSNTRKNLGARRLCRRPLLACRHGRRSLIGGAGSLSSCNIVMLMS